MYFQWVSRPTVISQALNDPYVTKGIERSAGFLRLSESTVTQSPQQQDGNIVLLKPSKMKLTSGFGSWLCLSMMDTGNCAKRRFKQDAE